MTTAIGRRYAKALLELAAEQGAVEKAQADLSALAQAWNQSAELRTVSADPTLPREGQRMAMDGLLDKMGVSPLVKNTVNVMADRGRLGVLPDMIRAFEVMAEEERGITRAEVTTAKPMPDSYFADLQKTLESVVGTRVVLVKKVDPSLIAGVITRVGDKVFDGSVRNRLQELKDDLLAAGQGRAVSG
ncbi:MAG: ATP synthase F1 subunit delta [Polyangiales bacterium]